MADKARKKEEEFKKKLKESEVGLMKRLQSSTIVQDLKRMAKKVLLVLKSKKEESRKVGKKAYY